MSARAHGPKLLALVLLLAGCHARSLRSFELAPSGVGFDDLLFSPELHRVLAPAGGTGCIHLFESSSLQKTFTHLWSGPNPSTLPGAADDSPTRDTSHAPPPPRHVPCRAVRLDPDERRAGVPAFRRHRRGRAAPRELELEVGPVGAYRSGEPTA